MFLSEFRCMEAILLFSTSVSSIKSLRAHTGVETQAAGRRTVRCLDVAGIIASVQLWAASSRRIHAESMECHL
jgi:hypothetical protein